MKILLVDDEPGLLDELKRGLNKRGHTVETAQNGQEAWDAFTDFPNIFDLVVTDVKMPVMDGMELLARIREYDSEALVIIMTGHGDLQMSVDALKLGAYSYFVKPFEARDLYSCLKKLDKRFLSESEQLEQMGVFQSSMGFSIDSRIDSVGKGMFFINKSFKWVWQLHEMNSPQMYLCLYEALYNAVLHGNLEITSNPDDYNDPQKELVKERENDPQYGNRRVHIFCEFRDGKFICEVEDEGKGFDFAKLPDTNEPSSLLIEGRGLPVIRYYMDDVSWTKDGKKIKMTKSVRR